MIVKYDLKLRLRDFTERTNKPKARKNLLHTTFRYIFIYQDSQRFQADQEMTMTSCQSSTTSDSCSPSGTTTNSSLLHLTLCQAATRRLHTTSTLRDTRQSPSRPSTLFVPLPLTGRATLKNLIEEALAIIDADFEDFPSESRERRQGGGSQQKSIHQSQRATHF